MHLATVHDLLLFLLAAFCLLVAIIIVVEIWRRVCPVFYLCRAAPSTYEIIGDQLP